MTLSWMELHTLYMRRTALCTFLFVAILGLGCMGVSAPGKAEKLKNLISLGKECKALFETYLKDIKSGKWYFSAFAYAYGRSESYACGLSKSPSGALSVCNTMSLAGADWNGPLVEDLGRAGMSSFPPGTTGQDLGGCKIYAKSPVDGKLAIV